MMGKYIKLLLSSTYVGTMNLLKVHHPCIFSSGTIMAKVSNYIRIGLKMNSAIACTDDGSLQPAYSLCRKDEASL